MQWRYPRILLFQLWKSSREHIPTEVMLLYIETLNLRIINICKLIIRFIIIIKLIINFDSIINPQFFSLINNLLIRYYMYKRVNIYIIFQRKKPSAVFQNRSYISVITYIIIHTTYVAMY